jgi:hypothetical protein
VTNPPTATCSLGPISCITVTAPDLAQVEACYTRYFDYVVAQRSRLSQELASLWNCRALTDHATLTLAPAAGDECVFRFIEAEPHDDYVPFATYGWNAAEIMVQNVDAMAERLRGSDFEVIGEPANLSFSDDIRAMQVLGPGRELLYLTEFKKPLPGLSVPDARCAVDRVFIVILGGASMAELQDFYAAQFGVPGAAPVESRVKGISAAFGNSPEHRYPIAALPLNGRTLIEVDEMPAQATARPARYGELPAGIAIVSFNGDNPGPASFRRVAATAAPYGQQASVAVATGTAGEMIEIIRRD